jgi:hypothetical protein
MKKLFTIALVIISGICQAQNSWEKVSIDSTISISFPVKPTIENVDIGQTFYSLELPENKGKFSVTVKNFTKMGVDDETIANEFEKEKTWDDLKKEILKGLGDGAKLINEELITINGIKSTKQIIKYKNKSEVCDLTIVIFYKGGVLYVVTFINIDGKADENMKQHFFDSIELISN